MALLDCARNGWTDLDGLAIQELATGAGLVEWDNYDPERHGEDVDAEPGEPFWRLTELGKLLDKQEDEE